MVVNLNISLWSPEQYVRFHCVAQFEYHSPFLSPSRSPFGFNSRGVSQGKPLSQGINEQILIRVVNQYEDIANSYF